MTYRHLNMDAYPRRRQFDFYNRLAYPYAGMTMNVPITGLPVRLREEGIPFFLTVCYGVTKAANAVPQFRQRILDGGIIEYDYCRSSHTVAMEDETFCFCTLDGRAPFREFLPAALAAQEAAKLENRVDDDPDEAMELLFLSTLPWFSQTSVIHPVPLPPDSNSRLTWGRFFRQGGETLLPVSVLCNHALVDGRQIGYFYAALEESLRALP